MIFKYIKSLYDDDLYLVVLKDENGNFHIFKCDDDINKEFDYDGSYKNLVFNCDEVIIGFDKIVRKWYNDENN